MEIIVAIVDFLRTHKRYQGKVLDSKNRKRDISDKLYDRVLAHRFPHDNDAAESIYGRIDNRYRDLI